MSEPNSDVSTAELARRAASLLQAGSLQPAIAAYRALLDRAPQLADAWYNLGYLQRAARQFEAALASYEAALAHGIAAPEDVRVNRAVILFEHLGRDEAAADELDRAVSANPRFLPAWLNLGLLNEDRGDRDGARAAYRRARDIDPAHGRADARLAAIDIAEGQSAAAVETLSARLAGPALSPEGTAEIGFMLGNALDAAGDYDPAFDAFVAANRVALSLIPPSRRYSRDTQDQLVNAIIRAFPRPASRAMPSGDNPPIYICGMFRSGSTLCERLLAQHSRITAGGELETIPALVERTLTPYPASVAGLTGYALDTLRTDVLDECRARFPHADVLTDKLCANFLHIGLIKSLFPQVKIVHTRRHAIDNILSIFFLYFEDTISYGFALDDAVHYYNSYRRLMDHWRTLYPDDIFDFNYDLVVRDPEPVMRNLLAFCQLESEPQCLTGHPADGTVRTASAWQVRRPLHDRSSGRWHNYAAHIPEVVEALRGY